MRNLAAAGRCTLRLATVLALIGGSPAFGQAADPISSDPATADVAFPARLSSYSFRSGSAVLNGRALIAQGQGPHPTIVLLHGMPGNELNLDVAQAARRAGWNVFMFHYRGSWGSGGDFSFGNVVADTAAALAYVRGLGPEPTWRVDAKRVVLVGHSVGGFAALTVGALDPEVKSIASISGFDVGKVGSAIPGDQSAQEFWMRLFRNSNALRIPDPEALVTQWTAAAPEWQFEKLPPKLAKKNVLLIAATKDTIAPPATHHTSLAAALKADLGSSFAEVSLESDHSYSDRRIALTRAVLAWLERQR